MLLRDRVKSSCLYNELEVLMCLTASQTCTHGSMNVLLLAINYRRCACIYNLVHNAI